MWERQNQESAGSSSSSRRPKPNDTPSAQEIDQEIDHYNRALVQKATEELANYEGVLAQEVSAETGWYRTQVENKVARGLWSREDQMEPKHEYELVRKRWKGKEVDVKMEESVLAKVVEATTAIERTCKLTEEKSVHDFYLANPHRMQELKQVLQKAQGARKDGLGIQSAAEKAAWLRRFDIELADYFNRTPTRADELVQMVLERLRFQVKKDAMRGKHEYRGSAREAEDYVHGYYNDDHPERYERLIGRVVKDEILEESLTDVIRDQEKADEEARLREEIEEQMRQRGGEKSARSILEGRR